MILDKCTWNDACQWSPRGVHIHCCEDGHVHERVLCYDHGQRWQEYVNDPGHPPRITCVTCGKRVTLTEGVAIENVKRLIAPVDYNTPVNGVIL